MLRLSNRIYYLKKRIFGKFILFSIESMQNICKEHIVITDKINDFLTLTQQEKICAHKHKRMYS